MTLTTTEELKHLASSDNANELTRRLARECLANREAQPVALVDRRQAASGSICWQNGGKDLAHGTELFTAPPAPAVPEWEAQPVVWEMRYWNSGHNMWGDWERITAEQHAEMSVQHAADNDYEFRVLYDAPPSPVVPEGFKLMPLEITDEIAEAIAMEARCCGGIALCIYESALAAAKQGGADKI
ncbi:hypothetical protein [Serratia marcescens]|uniref:hypothetical protein n=1 Tax=Serratia marcescens TaxID=615 RepID=UPI0036FBA799